MGYPSIKEIAEEVKSWDFIQELPSKIDSFVKQEDYTIDGKILLICHYFSEELQARIDLIYTSETFDYILIRSMGLNIYRDIGLIYKEKDIFAAKAKAKLPAIMHSMEAPQSVNLGEMVAKHGILTWEYGNSLPSEIGPFKLYITPNRSIEHINGSIILIDYSDFARKDQFVVYYNRHRNEFFGEVKIAGVFHATKDFDATNLTQLQNQLELHLHSTLESITKSDHTI